MQFVYMRIGCAVTPELIATSSFRITLQQLFERKRLAYFIIDEAHCISSWGRDFRPSFRKLDVLRASYPNVPILATTATASKAVRQDIVNALGFREGSYDTVQGSNNRPNLSFQVLYLDGFESKVAHLIERIGALKRDDNTIVYCNTRDLCTQISTRLLAAGIPCLSYHAGLAVSNLT